MRKLLLFCFLISLNITAQKNIKVSGKIIETNTKQPLEYATFILTDTKTKQVFGDVTNMEGNFSFKLPKGNYNIKVEFIGFKTKTLPTKNLQNDTSFGIITLSEDSETLDEVEIIAEKSTVEIRLDKKIYNVGKDMTIKGGNASDVLDNVPSVNVDAEGAVSLRGNEDVRILINGKPSALVGLSGTEALRNLPADAIEKVEVITSPSARYDAEGTAGILNIILRKGKVIGFNGSIGLTVGNPDQVNIAPNLNYRTNKLNLFSNLGYTYRNGPGRAEFETRYLDEDQNITDYLVQDRDYDRIRKNFNGSIGLEYFINDESSITGTFTYQNSKGDDFSVNESYSRENLNSLINSSTRTINEISNEDTKQFALNYSNKFDDKGHILTVDLQYSDNYEEQISEILENGSFDSTNDEYTDVQSYLLQIDYVLPLKEKSQLELGHKTEVDNLSSNFLTTDDLGEVIDQVLNFDQTIYSYYTQYGNKINKMSYLLGLRAETTEIELDLEGSNNIAASKDYTELFPTVNLGYEFNDNDNISLGYNRRIRRPRNRFLNPFRTQSSATFIFVGNPDLDPTFTNSFDLGYNTRIKKVTFGTSIYYQESTNPFYVVSRTIDNGTVEIRQPINLDSENRYGFEANANYSPFKWMRLSGSFNFFSFKTDAFTYSYVEDGITENIDLEEVQSTSWFTRFNSRITLPAKIEWQTRVMYRGPQKTAQTDREGMFVTNLAFSKDILKDKASLVLNVSDLFNTRKRELITYNENRSNPESITDLEFQWRVRQINLTFTYRFNQKKKREKKEREFEGGGEAL